MKFNLLALAVLFVLGIVAIFTNIIWLFVIPAVIVAVLFLMPQREHVEEDLTDEDEEDFTDEDVNDEDDEQRLLVEYEELLAEKKRLLESDTDEEFIDEDEIEDFDWANEVLDDDIDEIDIEADIDELEEPVFVDEPIVADTTPNEADIDELFDEIDDSEVDSESVVFDELEEITDESERTESPVDEPQTAPVETVPPKEEKAADAKKQAEDDELALLEELL